MHVLGSVHVLGPVPYWSNPVSIHRDHITLELLRELLRHGNILPERDPRSIEMSTKPGAVPTKRTRQSVLLG